MAAAYFFVFAAVVFPTTLAVSSCKQIDVCSCETSDGKRISLWDIDSGSNTKPSFTGIKDDLHTEFSFLWNPCTPFTKSGIGSTYACKDVLVCQESPANDKYGCGGKSTTFSTDDNGNVVITYEALTQRDYTRQTKLTLKCDKSVEKATFGDGITEHPGPMQASSLYTAVVTTKCACPGICTATKPPGNGGSELSVGSILLIIFIPLLLIYFVAGLLFNKFHRGIAAMPEMIPNYSFWGDLPFLVKDGCVFACSALGNGCRSLCSKIKGESYASI